MDKPHGRHRIRGEGNVLIISHGGVCGIINAYFRDMTNEEFFLYTLENGQLEEFDL